MLKHRRGETSKDRREYEAGIVGESEKMKEVRSLIRYVVPTSLAVYQR